MNNIILKDFADKPFIQMYLLKDVQGLQNKFVETIYFSVVIGFLLLVVLWLATKFVFSQFTRSVIALSDELSESHAKMASVFNTTNEGLAVLDSEGRIIEVNKAFNDIFEQSTSELLNLKFQDVFPELWAAIEERKPVNVGYRTPQGSDKSLEVSFHLMDGHSLTLLACKDITQLRKQQIEIENYIKVVDDNVITSKADLHGIITYASAAFCRTSGYEKDELIGQKHSIIRHPDMPSKVFDDMWYTITKGKTWQGEVKNLKKDGTAYWVATSISADRDERNKIVGYTAIRQDITDKKQVELLSITDELTGLKNRRYYNMVFESEYSRRQRENKPFLFVLLDLDHFKRYNDHYGHQKGDMVLAEFSDCIRQCFKRSGDILFRLGGEEFAGILQIHSAVEAQDLVDKVNQELEVLNVEHVTNSVKNHVTVSIGGVVITDYSRGYLEKDIYRMADEALYLAKSQGRNQAVIKRL